MAVCMFCDRPVKARGLCQNHYSRALKRGEHVEFLRDHQPLAGRLCSVPGCGKPAKSRLYCSMHAERMRREGGPGEAAPRHAAPNQPCPVPGCARKGGFWHGYCVMHAHRVKTTGEPGPVASVRGERGAGHVDKNGYRSFRTGRTRTFEHRLVWEAANGPIPPRYYIHHINGDRLDNRLENLELLTHAEHARRHGILDAWRARKKE